MTKNYSELRQMSKDELIQEYDKTSKSTSHLGLNFIREEIHRRDTEEETDKIVDMTYEIRNLTRIITVLTVPNTFFVAASLYLA